MHIHLEGVALGVNLFKEQREKARSSGTAKWDATGAMHTRGTFSHERENHEGKRGQHVCIRTLI